MLLLGVLGLTVAVNLSTVLAGCPRKLSPRNGTVVYMDTDPSDELIPPQKVAVFFCSAGLVVNGSETSVCGREGTWSNEWPHCVPPTCPEPPAVAHASVAADGEGRRPGDRVYYQCQYGYIMNHKRFIKCKRNFKWTTNVECVQDVTLGCTAPPDIPFARYRRKPGAKYAIGAKLLYYCMPGYSMSGFPNIIKCLASEQWSNTRITCSPVSCGNPGTPTNGVRHGDAFHFPSLVRYSCEEGHTLAGSSIRTCQADRRWSRYTPTCEPVKCDQLATPVRGILSTREITFSTRVVVSCDNGFMIEDGKPGETQRVLVCDKHGHWNATVPNCKESDCGNYGALDNGNIVYSDGTLYLANAYFNCHEGSDLEGVHDAYCGSSGLWSKPLPTCWGRCDIPVVANGYTRLRSGSRAHGESVRVYCEVSSWRKFTRVGPEISKCLNGSWEEVPTCMPAACTVRRRRFGYFNVSGATVDHGSSVALSCPPGYHPTRKPPASTCAYGYWKPDLTHCSPDPCYLPKRSEGTWFRTGREYVEGDAYYRHDTKVYVTCSTPKFAQADPGSPANAECVAGKWSPPLAYCIEAPCKVPSVSHGSFTGLDEGSFVPHNESVTVVCGEGYHPRTMTMTCERAEFSPHPQACQPDGCILNQSRNGTSYVQHISYFRTRTLSGVTELPDGTVIHMKCDDNYARPRGVKDSVTCHAGHWEPNIVDCLYGMCLLEKSPLGTRYRTKRSWRRDVHYSQAVNVTDTTVVHVECQTGYSLPPDSPAQVTCMVGVWTPSIRNCVQEVDSAQTTSRLEPGRTPSSVSPSLSEADSEADQMTTSTLDAGGIAVHNGARPCTRERGPHGYFYAGEGQTRDGETRLYKCDAGYKLAPNFQHKQVWVTCTDGVWIPEPVCGTDSLQMTTSTLEAGGIPSSLSPSLAEADSEADQMTTSTLDAGGIAVHNDHGAGPCTRERGPHGYFYAGEGQTLDGVPRLYRCDAGYKLAPNFQHKQVWVTCIDGVWIPEPVCGTDSTTSTLSPSPSDACNTAEFPGGYFDAVYNTFQHGDEVRYRCNQGYSTSSHKATETVTCIAGSWSPTPRCLFGVMGPWEDAYITKGAYLSSLIANGSQDGCKEECLRRNGCSAVALRFDQYCQYPPCKPYCVLYTGQVLVQPYNPTHHHGTHQVSVRLISRLVTLHP